MKTTEKGEPHGYDGAKKVNGRKHHLLVDTLGLLLAVHMSPANTGDRDGAVALLRRLGRRRLPRAALWLGGLARFRPCTLSAVYELIRSPRRGHSDGSG